MREEGCPVAGGTTCGGLTLHLRDVGELFGVAAVAGLLPPQLQEDGDGPVDLGAVVGRRLEDDGVLRRERKQVKRRRRMGLSCLGSVYRQKVL